MSLPWTYSPLLFVPVLEPLIAVAVEVSSVMNAARKSTIE